MTESPGGRLRALMNEPGTTILTSVPDALTARTAETLGFKAVHVGGSLMAATCYALPDHGLVGPQEQLEHAARVIAAVDIPVIVDLDDCGGNPVRVRRTVASAERYGVAGFHIEDADFVAGKHFVDGDGQPAPDVLLPIEKAAANVAAAVEARADPSTVIIARTDAHTYTTVDDAIGRANMYADAGADMVMFPLIAPGEIERVYRSVSVPVLHVLSSNWGEERLAEQALAEQAGVRIVLHVLDAALGAFDGMWQVLTELHDTGTTGGSPESYQRFLEVVGVPEWSAFSRRHGMERRPWS